MTPQEADRSWGAIQQQEDQADGMEVDHEGPTGRFSTGEGTGLDMLGSQDYNSDLGLSAPSGHGSPTAKGASRGKEGRTGAGGEADTHVHGVQVQPRATLLKLGSGAAASKGPRTSQGSAEAEGAAAGWLQGGLQPGDEDYSLQDWGP